MGQKTMVKEAVAEEVSKAGAKVQAYGPTLSIIGGIVAAFFGVGQPSIDNQKELVDAVKESNKVTMRLADSYERVALELRNSTREMMQSRIAFESKRRD